MHCSNRLPWNLAGYMTLISVVGIYIYIILTELKIRPVVKKIQNYRNKRVQYILRMDRDRQTDTLNYKVSTMWESKTGPSEDISNVNWPGIGQDAYSTASSVMILMMIYVYMCI